ncbi:YlbL family protein [Bifidobacterium dolichotidis]|nr:S16 family serine protease [Bifidobacterium dolichotidis]
MNRLRHYVQGKPLKYFTGLFAVILAIVMLFLPSPYAIQMPGPTQNVLGKQGDHAVISIDGAKTYPTSGELLLTTVNATGVPGYPTNSAEVILAWFVKRMEVIPQEVVVPVGQTADEYKKESDSQMNESQQAAVAAGLALAKHLGVNTSGVSVKLHIEDIGGPSAGMMYALGIVDKLTPQNEANGQIIAGTGTIDAEGKVGPIGGIDLKMVGAQESGAKWFLAPADNCSQVVGHVPEGLRDVRVSTLDEAYKAVVAIGKGQGDSLPQCTVQ